jgi:hypothetical protein
VANRVDILLRRGAIAKAFGDPDAVKAFEQQQELLAGHPDEIAAAQTTANGAQSSANTANSTANAIKGAPIVTMSATPALSGETVLDAAVIIAKLGYTPGKAWVAAPALSTSSGAAGDAAYDAGFFYLCIATNTWVRTPLATF